MSYGLPGHRLTAKRDCHECQRRFGSKESRVMTAGIYLAPSITNLYRILEPLSLTENFLMISHQGISGGDEIAKFLYGAWYKYRSLLNIYAYIVEKNEVEFGREIYSCQKYPRILKELVFRTVRWRLNDGTPQFSVFALRPMSFHYSV